MHFIPCIRRVSHAFQACISYHAGPYDSPESFKLLAQELTALEGGRPSNRLYFLSVPPPIFGAISAMIDEHARATEPGFTRLVIEKPFGRDSESFEELNESTAACFHETQRNTVAIRTPWAASSFEELHCSSHMSGEPVGQHIINLRI